VIFGARLTSPVFRIDRPSCLTEDGTKEVAGLFFLDYGDKQPNRSLNTGVHRRKDRDRLDLSEQLREVR
jgi:hypothetical protein